MLTLHNITLYLIQRGWNQSVSVNDGLYWLKKKLHFTGINLDIWTQYTSWMFFRLIVHW